MFEEEGFDGMSDEARAALTDQIRQKLAAGDQNLTPAEEGFLQDLSKTGYAGESDGDPIVRWQEHQAQKDSKLEQLTGKTAKEAHTDAANFQSKVEAGKTLTKAEAAFLKQYDEIMGNSGHPCKVSRGGAEDAEGDWILANIGWTDEARAAAEFVRQMKARQRAGTYPIDDNVYPKTTTGPRAVVLPTRNPRYWDGRRFVGSGQKFDETTGQYVDFPAAPPPADAPAEPVPPPQPVKPVQPVKPGVPVTPVQPVAPRVLPPGLKPRGSAKDAKRHPVYYAAMSAVNEARRKRLNGKV